MKNFKKVLLTGIFTTATLFAIAASSNAATVKITGDVVNVRKSASTSSSVVAKLSKNIECEYLGEEGNWYKVKYQKYTGYVSKQYTKLVGEVSNKAQETTTTKNTETKTEVKQETTTKVENKEDTKTTVDNQENKTQETTQNTENKSEETVTQVYKKFNQNTAIRILPLIHSSTLEQSKKNQEVLILTETSGWSYVQTNTISGWVRTDTLGESITKTVEGSNTSTSNSNISTSNTTTQNGSVGYISEQYVNMRSGAGTNYAIVQVLKQNTKVTIIKEQGNWYQVKYGNTTGYVSKDFVSDSAIVTNRSLTEPRTEKEDGNSKKEDSSKKNDDVKSEKATTTSNNIKNTSTDTTTKIVKGVTEDLDLKSNNEVATSNNTTTANKTTATATNNTNTTNKSTTTSKTTTATTTNKTATTTTTTATTTKTTTNTTNKTETTSNTTTETKQVANSNDSKATSTPQSLIKGTDVIAYAKKYLGYKYVWAGDGSNGTFDCSGFTMYVYKHFGVSLPHYTVSQYNSNKGVKITKQSDLQMGDIVFLTDYVSGAPCGHCGIYISDGKFIHADSTVMKVNISDLNGMYKGRFCGALRVTKK